MCLLHPAPRSPLRRMRLGSADAIGARRRPPAEIFDPVIVELLFTLPPS